LFVAAADGSGRRRLASNLRGCAPAFQVAWAPDSRRVAFAGGDAIRVANAEGSSGRVIGNGEQPAWSPDGKSLAFVRSDPSSPGPSKMWLEVMRAGVDRTIGAGSGFLDLAWSPNGKWIAYGSDRLFVVHPDGSGRRELLNSGAIDPAWSADGRYLAFSGHGLSIADVATGAIRVIEPEFTSGVAWSPRGHLLAFGSTGGLKLADAGNGNVRLLNQDQAYRLVWAPDGRSLGYLARTVSAYPFLADDIRVTDLHGHAHTVVAAQAAYGGDISGLVWTRPPATTRYRAPRPRSVATVTPQELVAPWPIERLATDDDRIAYVSCGHVFVWTPRSRAVVQADAAASMAPACTTGPDHYNPFVLFGPALAGDQIAYAGQCCNSGKSWSMLTQKLDLHDHAVEVGAGVGEARAGDLVGSGPLLVFSTWSCAAGGCSTRDSITRQSIWRLRDPAWAGTCPTAAYGNPDTTGPCQELVSQPGPLTPFDVDAGRIAAGGSNATWVLDGDGKLLLSIPVSPLAAQLAGPDLVTLTRGELRDYDSTTGAQQHSWPLPDVTSGRDCSASTCASTPQLVLEDAAHGLAAYTLDRQIHLLRLADGQDAVIGAGTLARFTTSGLVYANGAHIHLIPNDQFPLR